MPIMGHIYMIGYIQSYKYYREQCVVLSDLKKCLVQTNALHLQVCLGLEKAPLGEAQKDDGGFQSENILPKC